MNAKILRAHDVTRPVFTAEPPTLLTTAEAARELRCSKAHLHNVINGKVHGLPPLPVVRIGRRVLIRREALKRWTLWIEGREAEIQRGSGLFLPAEGISASEEHEHAR